MRSTISTQTPMRQRVTYLLPAGTANEPSRIKVDNANVASLEADGASEEWQVKLDMHELPDEIRTILEGSEEFHLRWSSPRPREFLAPLVSRLTPGLHAFFTPRAGHEEVALCPLLRRLSGNAKAKCASLSDSFAHITAPSDSSVRITTFQWHSYSHIDVQQVGQLVLGKVCSPTSSNGNWIRICHSLVEVLGNTTHVDLDFDAGSRVLTFATHWPANDFQQSHDWNDSKEKYSKANEHDRLEIGVLQAEASSKPEQLTIGGHLLVVGEDKKPSRTHFSFPSRHHPLPSDSAATFTTNFQHPTGLHPKLEITLPAKRLHPPQESCKLHTYLTLPSALFIDRFQVADSLFLESQNLVALHSLIGAQDLEAPDWVTPQWGSALLLELAVPNTSTSAKRGEWTVTIPLHFRYIDTPRKSTDARSEATVEVPWPIVFWACAVDDDVKLSNNPFDRVNLGYDGLFDTYTIFYHIPPATTNASRLMVEEVKVPILNADNADMVQIGTLIAVAIGFAWVCWKLLRGTVITPTWAGDKGGKAQ